MRFQKTIMTVASIIGSFTMTATTSAASGDWHQYHKAGSIGSVDESDRDEYEFNGARVLVKSSLNKAKVLLRYDIEHGMNGHITPDYVAIIPRYRDNGENARVVIKLKTYHIESGVTSTLLTFDSDTLPEENGYRIDNVNVHDPSWQFLNGNAYWLEVTLHKKGAGGRPELGMIRFIWREE